MKYYYIKNVLVSELNLYSLFYFSQPNEVLVKIGAILGLHQIQRMLFDMDSGRADLISGIMLFVSRPNKKTHAGIKCGEYIHFLIYNSGCPATGGLSWIFFKYIAIFFFT